MSDQKEKLEDLLQFIIEEVFKKGFPPSAAGRTSRNIEEIMNMMRNFKNRAYAHMSETDEKTSGEKTEIEALKEQIALLKQQLKDKDEIIALLKEKLAAQRS
ncbi:MAG: hypothetical protein NZ521_00160 [Flammeovirgaceae bacterium]|nr:hypothetical protein [Flammeovirgaceae bacterium]MDW8286466.1 hypothetical protein [Flammeovirgaceae bacterium]